MYGEILRRSEVKTGASLVAAILVGAVAVGTYAYVYIQGPEAESKNDMLVFNQSGNTPAEAIEHHVNSLRVFDEQIDPIDIPDNTAAGQKEVTLSMQHNGRECAADFSFVVDPNPENDATFVARVILRGDVSYVAPTLGDAAHEVAQTIEASC